MKKLLVGIKKHQLWVICGSILVVSLVCWWLDTDTLTSLFKQRKSKLDGEFNSVSNIRPKHPNQGVIDAIRAKHVKLKEEVLAAWEVLYQEQKEKNPLPKVLSKEFKREFESLKPKGELGSQYREEYQNFIKEHFGTLESIIDRRRPVKPKEEKAEGGGRTKPAGGMGLGKKADPRPLAMPGAGRDTGREEELIGTVEWDDSDCSRLEGRFVWEEAPSTLAVLLAQEDLWVYEALLRVIKNTNEGATGHATAPVKRIEALEIGQDAAKAWKGAEGVVFRPGQATGQPGAAAGVPGGPPGGMPGSGPSGGAPIPGPASGPGITSGAAPGGSGSATSEADAPARRALIEGRYVDDKGQPLPYEAEYPYAKHPYAEFKMMPIRMNLVMDQRRLPRLLVECANSNMPIEVRHIRIRNSEGEMIDLSGAAAPGVAGPQPGPGPIFAKPPGGPMPARKQPQSIGAVKGDNQEAGQYDIPVEIHGVIYIYSPPDREKLGTGAAAEKAVPGAATPATPPAITPATPAAPANQPTVPAVAKPTAEAPAATPGTPAVGLVPAATPPATQGGKP